MSIRRNLPFDQSESSFDGHLEKEGILDEADAVAVKRVIDLQLDDAAQADAEEGIRQGLEDARAGRLRPVREFFAEFEAAHAELGQRTRSRPRPA
jgi:hypothetical protein